MQKKEEIIAAVRAVLERTPLVNLHNHPIDVEYDDGAVTLSGDVEGIAAKKLALEVAAATTGVSGIVDRLRIEPAEKMEDGAIRDHTCDALTTEPVFASYSITAVAKGESQPIRVTQGEYGLEIEVKEGVVILNGRVQSLSHKRLAGVLAWWVPGTRDVVNGLEIVPPEADSDDEVVDAVRLVLEKDPFVNASQIKVSCRNMVVTLEGVVAQESGKAVAESDAWYVFAVNGVVNRLLVSG